MVKSVRFFFLSVTIILAILIFGSHQDIFAQAGTSSADFIGTITDEQKNIISNAEVTIKDLKTNLSRVVATDEKGSYSIRQLTPGKYEIRIQADGFQSYVQEVLLQVGTIGVGNISLKVGQLEDVVEVSANAGVIESNKTESSSNVDAKAITSLPINKRNFLDLTLTAPRVRIDRTPPQGVATNSGFSVNGQSARSNNITIDGLDNNDLGSGIPRSAFSQDAIQEFQIVTDNYSAEFGRAVGGVVNIITKGGGNSFNGSSFFFFRDESIAARDSLAPFKTPFEQYQAGIILSGPIKKIKLFLYFF
ncbi:MAG: carboxypeptidase regulatory-like domain-containing protein [Blastocatellia bacterium]|nr:carboxypeptidase regulatory-like domain-containing protein [Blastocatellia bacterium]